VCVYETLQTLPICITDNTADRFNFWK